MRSRMNKAIALGRTLHNVSIVSNFVLNFKHYNL